MDDKKDSKKSNILTFVFSIIASIIAAGLLQLWGIHNLKDKIEDKIVTIDNIEKDLSEIKNHFFNKEDEGHSIKVGYSKEVLDGTAIVFLDNTLNLKKTEEIILRDPSDVNYSATIKVVIIKEIKRNKGQEEDIYISEKALERLGIDKTNKRLYQGVFELRLKKCSPK